MDDLSKYQSLFLETARKHVQAMHELLNLLQKDDKQQATLNDLHIHAHSLKGEAFALSYIKTGTYITVIEQYLKNLISSDVWISASAIRELEAALSQISRSLEKIEKQNHESDDLEEKAKQLKVLLESLL